MPRSIFAGGSWPDLMKQLVPSAKPVKVLLSLRAAAAVLGVSRSTLREWIARKQIRTVKVGARQRVPQSELTRVQAEGPGKSVKTR